VKSNDNMQSSIAPLLIAVLLGDTKAISDIIGSSSVQ